MDCDSCGRHRPSQEIALLREADGRLVMSCVRCRRLTIDRRGPAVPTARPTVAAAVSAVPAPIR